MKEIMTVYDIREIPNRGTVLAGTNSELDTLSLNEIRRLIGQDIEIHQPDGEIINTQVAEVDVAHSLIGKKNIFILIKESVDVKQLKLESVICSTDQDSSIIEQSQQKASISSA